MQFAAAHLAAAGFEPELDVELARSGVTVLGRHGRLVLVDRAGTPAWAAVTWVDPVTTPVASIGEAARILRGVQRNWYAYAPVHAGRARLVQERLPHVSARPLGLTDPAPTAPLGGWTLLRPGELLHAAQTTSAFVLGEVSFVEDSTAPSRAYRKLAEAFAVLGARPEVGDHVVDLGASPGGWTWLLAKLGARVTAVDKAPLAESVGSRSIRWLGVSAFSLDPGDLAEPRWLCSDIACYPERLLRLVHRWLDAWPNCGLVCSIKLQGSTDHAAVEAFASVPGGTVRHLHHNRHELTLLRPPQPS